MSFGVANKFVLTSLLAVALVSGGTPVSARTPSSSDEVARIALNELPPEGRQTYRFIRQGGPFPYEKDGTVFGNREKRLPLHPRGYYREYTVPTPGSKDRGGRRIVCGGPPTVPEACYYTADHYASFRHIVE